MTDTELGGDPFLQALACDADLPEAVRTMHAQPGTYTGTCEIERGRGILIAFALAAGRFPPSGKNIPVTLHIQKEGAVWRWTRDFGGHKTQSKLYYDAHRNCVLEHMGGLRIWLQPVLADGILRIEIKRLSVFGMPCPRFLLPRSDTIEWQDAAGRFRFDVSARVPFLGQLIRYRGWLSQDHMEPGTP